MRKHPFFALALVLPALHAAAATPAEEAMKKAPMPHALLSPSGPKVIVHRARLQGFFKSELDPKAHLAQLKESVNSCIKHHSSPAKPPAAWPEYVISTREDIYIAANRSIRYSNGIAYVLHPKDCSLIENKTARAELVSALGVCSVDLIAKTADGECDKNGHASAAAPVRTKPTSPSQAVEQAIKSGVPPQIVASMKSALSMTGAPTGAKKTLHGVTCEVWSAPMQQAGTVCLATGGAAFPVTAATSGGQPGLTLESRAGQTVTQTAIEARLDDSVPAAIFTPYLGAGYKLNQPDNR